MGFYDGVLGPGSGTVVILLFTKLLKYDLKTASGNAKAALLASTVAASASYILAGKVVWTVAVPVQYRWREAAQKCAPIPPAGGRWRKSAGGWLTDNHQLLNPPTGAFVMLRATCSPQSSRPPTSAGQRRYPHESSGSQDGHIACDPYS